MADAFVANPMSLLSVDASTKSKEDSLVTIISAYLAYRADALDGLMSVIPQTSDTQARAIGRSLFRVRFDCIGTDDILVARAEKLAQVSGGKVFSSYRDEESLFIPLLTDQQPPLPPRRPTGSSATLPIIRDMGLSDPGRPKLGDPFILPRLR